MKTRDKSRFGIEYKMKLAKFSVPGYNKLQFKEKHEKIIDKNNLI